MSWDSDPTRLTRAPREGQGPSIKLHASFTLFQSLNSKSVSQTTITANILVAAAEYMYTFIMRTQALNRLLNQKNLHLVYDKSLFCFHYIFSQEELRVWMAPCGKTNQEELRVWMAPCVSLPISLSSQLGRQLSL